MTPAPRSQVPSGQASEEAVEAAAKETALIPPGIEGHDAVVWAGKWTVIERMLAATHSPALGLDRSVRLGDLIDWLLAEYEQSPSPECRAFAVGVRMNIERTFTECPSPSPEGGQDADS